MAEYPNTAIKLDHKADSLPGHDLQNKKQSASYFIPTVALKAAMQSFPKCSLLYMCEVTCLHRVTWNRIVRGL